MYKYKPNSGNISLLVFSFFEGSYGATILLSPKYDFRPQNTNTSSVYSDIKRFGDYSYILKCY